MLTLGCAASSASMLRTVNAERAFHIPRVLLKNRKSTLRRWDAAVECVSKLCWRANVSQRTQPCVLWLTFKTWTEEKRAALKEKGGMKSEGSAGAAAYSYTSWNLRLAQPQWGGGRGQREEECPAWRKKANCRLSEDTRLQEQQGDAAGAELRHVRAEPAETKIKTRAGCGL